MDEQSLYGSIHTHFESDKDAVNAHFIEKDGKSKISFEQSLKNFKDLGAKKIAVTEHGAFNSFEDLYAASKSFDDLDIIPGCEVYLDYKVDRDGIESNKDIDRAHLVLIAKDHEGYLQLCKIISESNKNLQVGKSKDFPIVTYEMLEKYATGGHLVASSACIAGPLCRTLRADYLFTKEKKEKYEATLGEEVIAIRKKIDYFEKLTNDIKKNVPTPAEKKALKEAKDIEGLARANTLFAESKEKLNSPEYITLKEEATTGKKYLTKAKLTKKANNYMIALEKYNKIKDYYNTKKYLPESIEIYKKLVNIFRDDFYFELQNHHLPSEEETYNALVRFAIQVGNPRFIASNDIHITMHKSDPNFNAEIIRRKVARYNALKRYPEDSVDEQEYGIKTDAELREELLSIIKPYKDWSSEMIVDTAISNIKGALDKCKPFEVIKDDHYPKFADNDIELFENLIQNGLKEKFADGFPKGKEEEYEKRLKKEINIIESMGYASYHLIVQNYLQYGRLLGYLPDEEVDDAPLDIEELDKYITEKGYKRRGYPIGPGRGSAAGSLACYLLGITDIDPIKYGLLFERFLNPERKSMPKQYWASTVNMIA